MQVDHDIGNVDAVRAFRPHIEGIDRPAFADHGDRRIGADELRPNDELVGARPLGRKNEVVAGLRIARERLPLGKDDRNRHELPNPNLGHSVGAEFDVIDALARGCLVPGMLNLTERQRLLPLHRGVSALSLVLDIRVCRDGINHVLCRGRRGRRRFLRRRLCEGSRRYQQRGT